MSLLTSFDLKGCVYLFKLFLNDISIEINCNVRLKSCPVIDGLVSKMMIFSPTLPNLNDIHGDPINDPFVRANMFNDQFCNVYKYVGTNSTNRNCMYCNSLSRQNYSMFQNSVSYM